MDFALPVDFGIKHKRNRKVVQIPGSCRRPVKTAEHETDDDTNNNCSLAKKTGLTGDQRKNLSHPEHSTVKMNWNTWERPGK